MEKEWKDWEFEENDPSIHELDDPYEKPQMFSEAELASLFGED